MGRVWLCFWMAIAALLLIQAAGCKRRAIAGDTHAEAQHLFDSTCAVCHGRDGRGGVPAAEGLPPPRNFRDAAFQASRTDAELKDVIKGGKGQMPAFGPLFDDEQLTLLVAYVRGFNPNSKPKQDAR
jgi:mono/diheme cytochrome c family protein